MRERHGNQSTRGLVVAAAGAFVAIPLLFLYLLPSLIFGGVTESHAPADPENPIFNSDLVVEANIAAVTYLISDVFTEAMEETLAEIEADFAASGAAGKEIKKPYENAPFCNANRVISLYCAANSEDVSKISVEELASVLQANKSELYTFTCTTEERKAALQPAPEPSESSEEDGPNETPPQPVMETWRLYTVVYNGETAMESMFALTEEQRGLAENYAQNLSLFLGDGAYQGVSGSVDAPHISNIRFMDGKTEVVYYNQCDPPYNSAPYGTDYIGGFGCGPTAMSIVISSMTDDVMDPIQMARWSYEHGYWCSGQGSYHALIPGAAQAWGLPVEGCGKGDGQKIVDALSEGKLVVAIMMKGHFTNGGHFIVLRGVRDGKILVADPSSYTRSEQAWDLSIILNEASIYASAGGPFWIIG